MIERDHMGTSHFRFQLDHSPDGDLALEAWRQTGGRDPSSVERLVEIKHQTVYQRAGIFRLGGVGPAGKAVVAKHGPSRTLSVEALVYGDVLPRLSLSAPGYYGYLDKGMHSWLFLEEMIGETFSPTSHAHRGLAVRWLAKLHSGTSRLDLAGRLPPEGPEQYLRCITSARQSLVSALDTLPPETKLTVVVLLDTLAAIESDWSEVCERSAPLPHCLVHADFVNKNVMIVPRAHGDELVALDWGIAGWGVPAPDLEYLDGSDYFTLVKSVWPNVRLADIAYMKTVGIVMRHLGLVDVWASCLRDEPAWAMERLVESASMLTSAAGDMRGIAVDY